MTSRLAAAAVLFTAMLVAAPAAAGDGPMPGLIQGGTGVVSPDGATRFVTVGLGSETALEVIATDGGAVQNMINISGSWGVPVATYSTGAGEGLTPDGTMLVLGAIPSSYPQTESSFLFFDTKKMGIPRQFTLKGDFAYDAIGQLKSALGKESGGSTRLHEQYGYAYDAAGNLNNRTNNALIQTFSVNNKNEPTTETLPAAPEVFPQAAASSARAATADRRRVLITRSV